MRAGRMRHRVVIQTVTEGSQDAYGEPAVTTGTLDTVWAQIEPVSGIESYRFHEMHPEVTHIVKIRHLDGVTPKMHVVLGSRSFEITSVINTEERDRELVLMCTERI